MSEGINGQVYAEAASTGAVISGRRTFKLLALQSGLVEAEELGFHGDVTHTLATLEPWLRQRGRSP
ncbi:hypothetical protein [Amycolatopsis sp. NPDC059021]|uniref:hypothetical protein n=1 Tax=Amycolatopsis sp. NPDC059021 TaxID=3346704 RepID=UPI003670953F